LISEFDSIVHCNTNKVNQLMVSICCYAWIDIMHLLLTWYTLIMFLKILSHLILKIKSFMKYFKKGVLKYLKNFMKFLNISKWNISSCICTYESHATMVSSGTLYRLSTQNTPLWGKAQPQPYSELATALEKLQFSVTKVQPVSSFG